MGRKSPPGQFEVTCSVIWRVFECWWPRFRISGRSTCTSGENGEASKAKRKKRGLWDAGEETWLADWKWLKSDFSVAAVFGCQNAKMAKKKKKTCWKKDRPYSKLYICKNFPVPYSLSYMLDQEYGEGYYWTKTVTMRKRRARARGVSTIRREWVDERLKLLKTDTFKADTNGSGEVGGSWYESPGIIQRSISHNLHKWV